MAETVGKTTKACEQAQKCKDNSSMKSKSISVLFTFLGLTFSAFKIAALVGLPMGTF